MDDDDLLLAGNPEPVDDADIGSALGAAAAFNFSLTSYYSEFDEFVSRILATLPGCMPKKDAPTLKLILANLFDRHIRFPGQYLRFSRDRTYYSKLINRYNASGVGYASARRTIDQLIAEDYIEYHRGMNDRNSGSRFQSRIRPNSTLAQLFEPLHSIKDLICEFEGTECIVMRDVKFKVNGRVKSAKLIDYEDTDETHAMRSKLKIINTAITQWDIRLFDQLNSPKIYKRKLYRIFNNGSFNDGGRFYGACWEGLSKSDRGSLLIDGCLVEELDFSGFHIRMLYALKGIDLGDRDPYTINGLDKSLRPLLKVALLILINATGYKGTIAAIKDEILKKHPDYSGDIKQLVDAFITAHAPIKEYFHSGFGVKLQRIDSDIMEEVLYRLSIKGIPALPVHDSIVVKIGCRDEVLSEMNKAYKLRMGFDSRIDVSEYSWTSHSPLATLYSK